jgi:hypothetical protein
MSQDFNHPILPPSHGGQNAFVPFSQRQQFPSSFSPYQPQESTIPINQQHQPDLQRFHTKQRGQVSSRLTNLQSLRQQAQQQGFRPHTTRGNTQPSTEKLISWYNRLNRDRKVALASICLLLLLILSMGVIALTGGFQDTQGQKNQYNSPSGHSNAPASSPTPTSVSSPTATETPQNTPTPTQQPINVPQPVNTLPPTPTPSPTATPTPPPTTGPTPSPTVVPDPTTIPTATPTMTSGNDVAPTNPWGYDFNPGQTISNPPTLFCNYFTCANNFQAGQGYIVKCSDGLYSLTGGLANVCIDDGGFLRTLYAHG